MAHGANPKISVLFYNLYTEMGGGEVAVFNLIKEIDRSKFLPVMMFNRDGEFVRRVESIGIATIILPYETVMLSLLIDPRRMWRAMKASYAIYLFVKRNSVQVIHCSDVLSLLLVAAAAIRFQIPVVFNVIFFYEQLRIWALNILALFLVDKIVTNSFLVKNDLEGKTFFLKNKMNVAYHGVDLSLFTPRRAEEEHRLRQELRLDSSTLVVGMVGRFEPSKGHVIFLRAASLVVRQRSDVRFVAIGSVLFQDVFPFFKECYEQTLLLWHELNLEKQVTFLPHRTDMPEVMRDLDLLVVPSLVEGFGLVVPEALASGVPVVAGNTVGALEVVRDLPDVYVAERGNPTAFAECIQKALNTSSRKNRSSIRNAAEPVLNNLRWQEYARRMERIYASLAEFKNPPSFTTTELN